MAEVIAAEAAQDSPESILDALRQAADLSLTPDVSRGIRTVAQVAEARNSSLQIVVVGPTKAGKSTLINAILGRLAVPSSVLPDSLLPVSFRVGGEDDEDDSYVVRLAGAGLDAFIDAHSRERRGLSAEQAFDEVVACNSMVRRRVQEGFRDLDSLLSQNPSLCQWHLEVALPRSVGSLRGLTTLTDCPGSSEGGVVGQMVQLLLGYQVKAAALSVLVVRVENIVPLQSSATMAGFFGGKVDNCRAVLVINGIRDLATRDEVEKLLRSKASDSLKMLELMGIFYLNALTWLTQRLCKLVIEKEDALCDSHGDGDGAPPQHIPAIEQFLDTAGLSAYESLLKDEGVDTTTFLCSLDPDDIEDVGKEVGMQAAELNQFVERCADLRVSQEGTIRGRGELPVRATPGFQRHSKELMIIWCAMFPEAGFASVYDQQRAKIPVRLECILQREFTDEDSFDRFLSYHLGQGWPGFNAQAALRQAIDLAEKDMARCEVESKAAARTTEETERLKNDIEAVSSRLALEGAMKDLRTKVERELWAAPHMEEVTKRMDAACNLFGDEASAGDLSSLKVSMVMDHEVAIAWAANESHLSLLTGQYKHGRRILPSREHAQCLLDAFRDWCIRTVDAALLSGASACGTVGRWLAEQLREHADLIRTVEIQEDELKALLRSLPRLPLRRVSSARALKYLRQLEGESFAMDVVRSVGRKVSGALETDKREVFILGTGLVESRLFRPPERSYCMEAKPVPRRRLATVDIRLLTPSFWAGVTSHVRSSVIRRFADLASAAARRHLDALRDEARRKLAGEAKGACETARAADGARSVVRSLHGLREQTTTRALLAPSAASMVSAAAEPDQLGDSDEEVISFSDAWVAPMLGMSDEIESLPLSDVEEGGEAEDDAIEVVDPASLDGPPASFEGPPASHGGLCSELPSLWSRPPVACGATPTQVTIIVSQLCAGGRGASILEVARGVFGVQGIRVSVLYAENPGHEEELARATADIALCVLGGDAALRAAVNGIIARPDRDSVTLGLLPMNVTNGITHSIGIRTPREGFERVLDGQVREMDLLVFEDLSPAAAGDDPAESSVYALNLCGFGFGAAVAPEAKRSSFRKQLSGIKQLYTNPSYCASLEVPEGEVPRELRERLQKPQILAAVTVMNCKHSLGTTLAPRAQLDDGLLDVVVSQHGSRSESTKAYMSCDFTQPCPRSFGLHDYVQVSSLVLRPAGAEEAKGMVSLDGQAQGSAPFKVGVAPRALRVFA